MHDKFLHSDLIIEILMLGLLMLIKIELKVIAKLFAGFFLLDDANVLNDHGFDWRGIDVSVLFLVLFFLMVRLLLFVTTLWLYLR